MSTTTTAQQFARQSETLWRDTGRHVLALPAGERSDVVVLGGGSALLWRLLEQPARFPEVMARLQDGDDAPPEDVVLACLEDLVERGLVAVAGVGQ